MALIIVAGASGQHATVVYEAAILSGMTVTGFATIGEDAPTPILDCPWMGDVDSIACSEIDGGARFMVACGSNELRRQVSDALQAKGASFQSVYHPAAIVSPSASVEPGAAVLAGAIVGPRASIGRGAIINHAATVDHDCQIGEYVNISPGARLGGCVRAAPGVFVGLNASVVQGLNLGQNAIVGAGAVVTRDVAPGATVAGVPARRLRRS